MKRPSQRCCLNNTNWKNFLVYCSVSASFIALIVCFINSIVIVPSRNLEQNVMQTLPFPLQISAHRKPSFALVKEFSLSPGIKKFDNENARVIGFPLKHYPNLTLVNNSTKLIYLATPYFSEWNAKHYYALHLGNVTFHRYFCPVYNCYVTNDPSEVPKADAVLFHIRDLEVFSIPRQRTAEQVWILYSMEPPWLEIKDLSRFNGIFNWTMSYRRKSDVLMSYGFVGKRSSPVHMNITMSRKINKAVWFVSNCQTDSNREAYVERLRKVYPIDVYGGCGMAACRPPESKKCYIKLANRYKFYLAFENAICRDYVTEKLFNSIEYYIIPITLGGADYSSILPQHSFINAMEFSRPEDLGHYLWRISKDDVEYLSFFRWKNSFRSYLQPWMCDLCVKLHEPIVHKVNSDLEEWWNEGYSCIKWSNNSFVPVKKYAFPAYHTKIFN